jgi:hypothetical protein
MNLAEYVTDSRTFGNVVFDREVADSLLEAVLEQTEIRSREVAYWPAVAIEDTDVNGH